MPAAPKPCRDCKAEGKPLTRAAPYVGPRCRTHWNEKRRADRLRRSQRHVETTYGLTPAQYDALYAAQGGRCAICRRGMGLSKRLAVDHDHACCIGPRSCGRCVRGRLDAVCNDILAAFRDSPETFERGAAYLRDWPSRRAGIVP